MTSPFKIKTHTIHASHIREYPRATSPIDVPLLLCVKQYVPLDNLAPARGDVTLIATHGSGMPKELYEPLFEALHARSLSLGFRIRGIWIADAAHQGESGVANEGKLGNDPSWFDYARDMLALVNHFHAEMTRPIVGVGHSMGAGSLVLASLMHPRLFASLVLLEPVFDRSIHECQGPTLARASTFRRDVWSSLDEAEAAARKSKRGWDERVFGKWMEYGYRAAVTGSDSCTKVSVAQNSQNGSFDVYAWLKQRESNGLSDPELQNTKTQPVTLKTSKHQEVFSYLRPNSGSPPVTTGSISESNSDAKTTTASRIHDIPDLIGPSDAITPFYRAEPVIAHSLLPHLRPSVLYVFGAKSPLAKPELRAAKLGRTGVGVSGSGGADTGRVKEIVVSGATHLVPLEKVEECADAMAVWLGDEMGDWVREERRMREEWEGKTVEERTTVSAEWVERIRSML